MKLTWFTLLPLLAASCATQPPSSHPIARQVMRQGAEPERIAVPDNDPDMEMAVQSARKSVKTFIAALEHPGPGQKDFEVKKPFVQGKAVEHLWLSQVKYSGHRFHGLVDNHPADIKGVKMGDRHSVNPSEITDWSYVDHGKLVGGYTIRVLYRGLSPERQKALEKEANFRIE